MSPDDATTGVTPGSGGTPDKAAAGTDAKTTTATGGTPADGVTPSGTDDLQGLRSALAKEREERQALAKQLRELQDKDLPQAQRDARELAEVKQINTGLQAENKRLQTANTVLTLATKMGFADPGDAVAFVATGDVDGSDTKAVQERLAAILKDKPYLASAAARPVPGGADLGNKGQPPKGADMNDMMRRAVGIPTGNG